MKLIYPAQKINFSIKEFFGKLDEIRSLKWIWSHLLKKLIMKNFCAELISSNYSLFSRSVLRKWMLQMQRLRGYDGSWNDFAITQWPLYSPLSK